MTDKDRDRDRDLYDDIHEEPSQYDEEVGAESAVDRRVYPAERARDDDRDEAGGKGMGWLGLALSVIGLFFLPVVMGAAGIIIGIIAMKQGARALGGWAIGVGIAAIVITLFAAPFF